MPLCHAQRRGVGGAKVLSVGAVTATTTMARPRQAVSQAQRRCRVRLGRRIRRPEQHHLR
jgi:hypothetical protein